MTDQCVLADDGTCHQCELQIEDNEVIKCFNCAINFHALCKKASNMICNKSLLATFMQKSTKRNFVWYCDKCLTDLELLRTESQVSQTSKVRDLENKIEILCAKVDSISDVLSPLNSTSDSNAPATINSVVRTAQANNHWQNTSRVTIMKNSLEGSVNLEQLEKRIVSDQIQVTGSKRNQKGDVIITCPNSTAASKIKDLATEVLPGHTVSDPLITYSWVNVVGFETNHAPDAVFELLVKSNPVFDCLKGKSIDEAKDFLIVKAVKPCIKTPTLYRALIKVSNTMRRIIKMDNDRLRIGIYMCKVYDQAPLIKRCNKCQKFGHWVAQCSLQNGVACAKCGSTQHETLNCNSTATKNCINCHRAGIVQFHPPHTSDSTSCPCFIDYRKRFYSNSSANPNNSSLQNINQQNGSQSAFITESSYPGHYNLQPQMYNPGAQSLHSYQFTPHTATASNFINNQLIGNPLNAPIHHVRQFPNTQESDRLNH